MKALGWIFAAVLLVGGVGAAVWFSQKPPGKPPTTVATSPDSDAPASRALPPSMLEGRPSPSPEPAAAPDAPATGRAAAALEEIDTVLRDETISHEDAGRRLVSLASDSSVPEAIRSEALDHAMNLLPDEDFASLEEMVKTKATPEILLDRVFHEIHNRPVEVQLPTALLLMQRSGEEIATQARELLEFHLEEDFGDNPAAWTLPVQQAVAAARAEAAASGLDN